MKNCVKDRSRLNRAGGQAVLEGVMMKAGDNCSTACRKEDGTIVVVDQKFSSVRKKHKLLNIPIVRGVIGFFETMKLSVSTLNASAEAAGLEEEVRDTKAQKWLKKHIGIPIILTGGIVDAAAAEKLLAENKADLIGVGRAILRDSGWAKAAYSYIENN